MLFKISKYLQSLFCLHLECIFHEIVPAGQGVIVLYGKCICCGKVVPKDGLSKGIRKKRRFFKI